MRRAKGEAAPRDPDSLYRAVERAPKKFNPMRVPRALQRELPFQSKASVISLLS